MQSGRNRPCPCGSGKKQKVCCAEEHGRRPWLSIVAVIGFVALGVWAIRVSLHDAKTDPEGMVWDPEHGHYHRLPGAEPPIRPEGVPFDATWSSEHGHYHGADGNAIDVGFGDVR